MLRAGSRPYAGVRCRRTVRGPRGRHCAL